jgi:hypothetical protein
MGLNDPAPTRKRDLLDGMKPNLTPGQGSGFCLLFTILCPFGTRESIRRKVDHGGQIVLWYW